MTPELTLEALAQRLAALEQKVATLTSVIPPTRDWRTVVGISQRSEFTDLWEAEVKALREADRKAAQDEAAEQ